MNAREGLTPYPSRPFLFPLAMARLRGLTLSAREMDPVKKTRLPSDRLTINPMEADGC